MLPNYSYGCKIVITIAVIISIVTISGWILCPTTMSNVQHLDTEQTPEVRDILCSDPETMELMNGTGHPCN